MLERKILDKLLKWKNEKNKQCLLLQGPRQVGKTYIVDYFANNYYKNYIYINFEIEPKYKDIFNGNLDFLTLKNSLELYFPNIKIEKGETILFLDEIQACPNARVALKSFALDGTIDVVASGSLLGLFYKEISSYPVGYELPINIYPLDFEEFLWALGIKKEMINKLKDSFNSITPLSDSYINKMNEYFKTYMLIGGMPNVVNKYIETKSFKDALEIQNGIIENYKYDVLKYAKELDKQKILNMLQSIPAQLAKKNKKFVFSEIKGNDTASGERKYNSSMSWLKDAGIINFCYNLTEPALPLIANMKLDSYKIYMRDTGLLMAMLDKDIRLAIFNNEFLVNEGGILENICAEEILTRYESITYFERKGKLEIDFILDIGGVSTALEIKSGNNKQAKSLKSIIDNYPMVKRYIKLENNTNIYKDDEEIEHYPLFMIMFI